MVLTLAGKTLFLTGGSRGIGLAIALRAAHDGANVVIAAKSDTPHPTLPGTIHTAASAIEAAGGRVLALKLDVRDVGAVETAVDRAAQHFGGIDICINNASAIALTKTLDTDIKRFDLMQQINVRGTFAVSRACIPYLRKSANPHILTLSPPPMIKPEWFGAHLAYTLSKYGMTLVTVGLADEFRNEGIAANCLWPRTTIATAAIEFGVGGPAMMRCSRKPEIMADAAYWMLTQPSATLTGQCLLDEEALARAGVTDLEAYRVDASQQLQTDLFVEP